MKNIYLYLIVCCLAVFSACEKEGDKLIVSGLESSELVGTESDIELSLNTKDATMLAFTWNESELSISDTAFSIPDDIPNTTMEISASADFESYESVEQDDNMYDFTGSELNTLASDFGFTAGEATPMYFRMNCTYADNTDSYYSNVVSVNITSYDIDYTKGKILNSDQEETGFYLYSPDEDGEYSGFTGTSTTWANWYMLEGDGTVWGNDGDAGTEFLMSSSSTKWNFWYPGESGCFYVTASTTDLEWTATYIPDLTVSGDVDASMTFDASSVSWTGTITTTSDNANIKVSCSDAALYNMSTGTDDDAAIAKEFGFVADASGTLSFEESASSATDITITTAGTYTLTFYLSDPTNWYYELTEGSTEGGDETTIYEKLYLPGVDDGTSGSWTFDNFINLVDETALTYAGVVDVNSQWGYQMAVEADNWDDFYGMGDAEGTLSYQSSTNISAPDAGLYLIQADLANLTYSHTAIGSQIYIGGLNDVWDFSTFVLDESSDEAGVYTGTATFSSCSWGIQIYLVADDWDTYYGGSFDALTYKGANITEPSSLEAGTYNITVDLINGTCSFELQ